MTCERYWRDGILLVERGLDDPHRDGCTACTLAHASRQELLDALPLVGAEYTGDPTWQANVWQRIDGLRAPAPWRWRWQLAGAFAAACAVVLWLGIGRDRVGDFRPTIAVVKKDGKQERADSGTVTVDDHLRITLGSGQEVRIYRAEKLTLRIGAAAGSRPDGDGTVVDFVLREPVQYYVIIVATPVTPTKEVLDKDLAELKRTKARVLEHKPIPVL